MKYRKKPVVIEALQWTGKNYEEILDFTDGKCHIDSDGYLKITTVQGENIRATVSDYIIPDRNPGTFYPCEETTFKATYDEMPE